MYLSMEFLKKSTNTMLTLYPTAGNAIATTKAGNVGLREKIIACRGIMLPVAI